MHIRARNQPAAAERSASPTLNRVRSCTRARRVIWDQAHATIDALVHQQHARVCMHAQSTWSSHPIRIAASESPVLPPIPQQHHLEGSSRHEHRIKTCKRQQVPKQVKNEGTPHLDWIQELTFFFEHQNQTLHQCMRKVPTAAPEL